MNLNRFKAIYRGVAALSVMSISACASSPDARLYVLEQANIQRNESRPTGNLSVLIAPVVLPDYLKRSEIVFKSGDSRIFVNEFDKWAGSLENNMTSVITANLAKYLNTDEAFDYHANFTAKPDVTVRIRVHEFGPVDNSTNILNVSWELMATGSRRPVLFTDTFTTKFQKSLTGASSLSPETKAMSEALGQLSLKISKEIRSMTFISSG